MKHARADYARIQDPAGKIPDEEPVFLLRGQDRCAPVALAAYAASVEAMEGDPEIVKQTRRQAQEMQDWQEACASKIPDMPKADADPS